MTKVLIASSIVLLVGGQAFAQSSGYDKSAETTVTGTIRHVLSAASPDGTVGVHVELTTEAGPVRVALGPAMFIANNNYFFFADDHVYVVGAKIAKSGEIWARAISKDGKSFLTLRDEDGTPRWARATEEDPDGCGVPHAPIR